MEQGDRSPWPINIHATRFRRRVFSLPFSSLLVSRLFRARAIMHAQKNPRETIMPRVTVRSKGVSNSIVFFLSLSLSPSSFSLFPRHRRGLHAKSAPPSGSRRSREENKEVGGVRVIAWRIRRTGDFLEEKLESFSMKKRNERIEREGKGGGRCN